MVSLAFWDADGAKVEFIVKNGSIEERNDGVPVLSNVKSIRVDDEKGTLNDGDEVIPIRRDDCDRVIRWIRDVASRYCRVIDVHATGRVGSSKANNSLKSPVRRTRRSLTASPWRRCMKCGNPRKIDDPIERTKNCIWCEYCQHGHTLWAPIAVDTKDNSSKKRRKTNAEESSVEGIKPQKIHKCLAFRHFRHLKKKKSSTRTQNVTEENVQLSASHPKREEQRVLAKSVAVSAAAETTTTTTTPSLEETQEDVAIATSSSVSSDTLSSDSGTSSAVNVIAGTCRQQPPYETALEIFKAAERCERMSSQGIVPVHIVMAGHPIWDDLARAMRARIEEMDPEMLVKVLAESDVPSQNKSHSQMRRDLLLYRMNSMKLRCVRGQSPRSTRS